MVGSRGCTTVGAGAVLLLSAAGAGGVTTTVGLLFIAFSGGFVSVVAAVPRVLAVVGASGGAAGVTDVMIFAWSIGTVAVETGFACVNVFTGTAVTALGAIELL
jgi:hypothetical protein